MREEDMLVAQYNERKQLAEQAEEQGATIELLTKNAAVLSNGGRLSRNPVVDAVVDAIVSFDDITAKPASIQQKTKVIFDGFNVS